MGFLGAALGAGAVGLALNDHRDFNDKAKIFRADINASALKHNINPHILAALLFKESQFNPAAIGASGEIGIAQFKQIALDDVRQRGGCNVATDVEELFDPTKAIEAAACLLQILRNQFGDIFRALQAYNAGSGAVSADPSKSIGYASDILLNATLDYAFTLFDNQNV